MLSFFDNGVFDKKEPREQTRCFGSVLTFERGFVFFRDAAMIMQLLWLG
jgi:hypothetical protein